MIESEHLLIKLAPEDIFFLDKIFESMDNLALFTIIEGKNGLVRLLFPPSQKEEVMELLNRSGYHKKIIKT